MFSSRIWYQCGKKGPVTLICFSSIDEWILIFTNKALRHELKSANELQNYGIMQKCDQNIDNFTIFFKTKKVTKGSNYADKISKMSLIFINCSRSKQFTLIKLHNHDKCQKYKSLLKSEKWVSSKNKQNTEIINP